MKRSIITILAAAAVLAGCKQTKVEENKGYFVLQSVTADANLNEVNVSTKAMPSELVDINTFVVKIESNLEGGGTQTYNYKDILTGRSSFLQALTALQPDLLPEKLPRGTSLCSKEHRTSPS